MIFGILLGLGIGLGLASFTYLVFVKMFPADKMIKINKILALIVIFGYYAIVVFVMGKIWWYLPLIPGMEEGSLNSIVVIVLMSLFTFVSFMKFGFLPFQKAKGTMSAK